MNKRIIDPVCPRHTGLLQQGLVPVDLVNGPTEPEVVTVPKHKKHPPAGVKASIRTKVWCFGGATRLVLWPIVMMLLSSSVMMLLSSSAMMSSAMMSEKTKVKNLPTWIHTHHCPTPHHMYIYER